MARPKKKKRSISRTRRVVLDKDLGDALKREAMQDVQDAADWAWRQDAQRAIMKVARKKARLVADDVWATGLARPREPRALGPEMASAEHDGIIVSTNDFKLTAQASRHRAPVRVWQSLVHKLSAKALRAKRKTAAKTRAPAVKKKQAKKRAPKKKKVTSRRKAGR
jgi:hypothetical protein